MAVTAKVAVCVAVVWAWAAGMVKSTRARAAAAWRALLINMTASPIECCESLHDHSIRVTVTARCRECYSFVYLIERVRAPLRRPARVETRGPGCLIRCRR